MLIIILFAIEFYMHGTVQLSYHIIYYYHVTEREKKDTTGTSTVPYRLHKL